MFKEAVGGFKPDERDIPPVKKISRRDFIKSVGFVGLVFGGGVLSGCTAGVVAEEEPEPSPLPTTSLSPTPTESPVPPVTPTSPPASPTPISPTETPVILEPTPTPVSGIEKQVDGTFVVATEKGERLIVPKIAGLRQEIEERNGVKTVVYRAEKGNGYGLAENAYAGEFYPNVVVEKKQTGGLVLTAPVVLAELNNQLVKIPNQRDRWLIPLPVDIRRLDSTKPVNLRFTGYGDYQIPVVEIRFLGKAPAINVVPFSEEVRVVKDFYRNWAYLDSSRLIDPYTDKIYPGREMYYITVTGKLEGFSTNITLKRGFGEEIAPALGYLNVLLDAGTEWRDVTPDKILYVGGVPVFVAANSS